MFSYLQKIFLILFICIQCLVAMEKTANTSSAANVELIKILQKAKNNNIYCFDEQDWENIKKCLENGADPNLKTSDYLRTPLICLVIEHDRKDLCDYLTRVRN